VGGELIDPTTLYIGVPACNKEPRFEVVESANRVTVTAYAASPGLGASDCQDGATVELHEPLGSREVIDGSDGSAVALLGGRALDARGLRLRGARRPLLAARAWGSAR
jgi:hypothetical protein